MADHSHNSPIYRKLAEKERFRIPMLFYGNVLKQNYKGKKCGNLGSQLDISTTILNQLGYNSHEYLYGSDLLDGDSFVPYAFPGGFAGITSSSQYAYSERFKKILELKSPNKKGNDRLLNIQKCFFNYHLMNSLIIKLLYYSSCYLQECIYFPLDYKQQTILSAEFMYAISISLKLNELISPIFFLS